MEEKFPDYIETVLNEWKNASYFSYDNFLRNGRGSILVSVENNEITFRYLLQEYFDKNKYQKEINIIKDYEPEKEFILTFEENNGLRTIRLKAKGNDDVPVGIWFMKKFEEVVENQEKLKEEYLPDWFFEQYNSLIRKYWKK